ncbi:MAG TPA: ABC transporter substrate-binding protein [Acidimicrobiia bacterium]
MQDKTLRTIGASVVLAGIAFAGIAQAGSEDDQPPADIVVADPSTTEDVAGVEPRDEPSTTSAPELFAYRIGVLAGVSTDNFWGYYGNEPSVWNSYILGPTKPALFSLDPGTGTLLPELASAQASPTWDADGWRVRVPLGESLHWSDGAPITADDFVFTFETVRRLELGGSWADAYPNTIESVHADEGNVLRIEFTERPNLAVWPHGVGLAPVMPKHVWGSAVEGATAQELYEMPGGPDVSGGPLTLAAVADSIVVSRANPGYPDPDVPDVVEYHVYEDEDAMIAAVANGEIDSLLTPKGVTRDQLASIDGQSAVSVVTSPANGVRYLGFNLAREPMSAPQFRSALALLLDRESLASEIPHTGDVAWSMIPRANGQWFDQTAAEANQSLYAGDLSARLQRALGGLREAGYAWSTEPSVSGEGALVPGEGLTIGTRPPQPLTILTPGDAYDTARPEYVQRIADTLAVLGFDTRPVETDFDTVVDLAFTPGDDGELHYDMYMLGWTLGNPALPDFYRHLFTANGAMNNTGYSSKNFDRALAAYENAFTADQAVDALWTMEKTLAADLPYLVLYTSELTEIYRSDKVSFDIEESLGGLQGRLGGITDVRPNDD